MKELTQFEQEHRAALPEFLRPTYHLLSSEIVVRWINDCIEYEEGSHLPSKDYLESFQEWSGTAYTIRDLNKVLRKLGFYVNKVVRVGNRTHRCWISVRLKEEETYGVIAR